MRLLTGIPSRPAAVEAPASPASERPVAPGSPRDVIRPRFKIKAGSSLVERVPRVVPSPTGPDGGVGPGAAAAPTTTLPPASGSETPANPVTGADSLQQRLKSAWPAPEEDAGPQPTSRAPRPETLLPPPAEPTSRPNPQDRLAIVLIDKRSGAVAQRIATAEKIASKEFQTWLHHMNAARMEVYVSMNALRDQTS